MIDIAFPCCYSDEHSILVISRRYKFRWGSEFLKRDALLRKYRLLQANGLSSVHDKALVLLVQGCSKINSRLEEYDGEATLEGVLNFFSLKSIWYQSLLQQKLPSGFNKSYNINEIIKQCLASRLQLIEFGLFYREFNGRTGRVKECFVHIDTLKNRQPEWCLIPDMEKGTNLQISVETLSAICSYTRFNVNLLSTDIIIITYPRHINIVTGDASDFYCYIDDSLSPIQENVKLLMLKRLISHKEKERKEVAQPNYIKRYMNLSTYYEADYAPQHQRIGFKGAMRWVIDFELHERGYVMGMLDIRVVRFETSRMSSHQITEFTNTCLDFQDAISNSIRYFIKGNNKKQET